MVKIKDLELKLEILKQQLRERKLAKATLHETEEIKVNRKEIENLNIKIRDVKKDIRLTKCMERELSLMSSGD